MSDDEISKWQDKVEICYRPTNDLQTPIDQNISRTFSISKLVKVSIIRIGEHILS